MKAKIANVRNLLNEQMEENKIYSAKVDGIKRDAAWADGAKEEMLAALAQEFSNNAKKKRDDIILAVEELKSKEKTSIDLSDGKLANAISLVCSLGDSAPDSVLRDIENEFRGNQAGLEALKGAYKKAGLDTYNIDKNIYSVNKTYTDLAQGVFDAFRNPLSLSPLNDAFAVLNSIENVCEPETREQPKIELNTIPKIF